MASVSNAWTLESLERALRKELLSGRTSIKIAPLENRVAEVTLGDRPKIRVDEHQVGVRTAVIHELLHIVLDEEMGRVRLSEEIIIEALEEALELRIARSRRRVAWWRRHLRRIKR